MSQVEVDRIIQLINTGDVEKLSAEEFEQFQYQGFDPKKVVESLVKIKTEKSISDSEFAKEVYTMVAIGMIKGSVNDHNMTKMSDVGKENLRLLIGKYSIKLGGGRSQPAGVVTFPRVMATFPDIAVRLTAVIGPKEFSGGPMMSTRLPNYMKVQVFPAIIPKNLSEEAKKVLLIASLCYSIDQTIQISRIQNADPKTIADSQMNFVHIGHSSPVPDEEVRRKVFNQLNIATDFTQKIRPVLEDYKKKVDPNYQIPAMISLIYN